MAYASWVVSMIPGVSQLRRITRAGWEGQGVAPLADEALSRD
jgi:hypothetical protein